MKLALYFRSVRLAGVYVPNGLILPLCVGCFALFSFFVVAPPQYTNFEPLFAKPPEVGAGPAQGENSAPKSRKIAVRILEMETDGRLPEAADARRLWLMQERVGTNIFVRSGYLEKARFVSEITHLPVPEMRYEVTLAPAPSICANLDIEEGEDDEAQSLRNTASLLAISAVAVEKFHRNVLHRRMEWAYARAFSALFGRLPDVSLGPAQIRVSGVRQIAAEASHSRPAYAILHTPEVELVEILADECKSLKLAAAMMYHFLNKTREMPECDNERDTMTKCREAIAAAIYGGQRRKTSALIDYGPIVARMVNMLKREKQ